MPAFPAEYGRQCVHAAEVVGIKLVGSLEVRGGRGRIALYEKDCIDISALNRVVLCSYVVVLRLSQRYEQVDLPAQRCPLLQVPEGCDGCGVVSGGHGGVGGDPPVEPLHVGRSQGGGGLKG